MKVSTEKENYGTSVEKKTSTSKKIEKPRLYKVLLHNDDYTPMDFVVIILRDIFGKSTTDASHVMWTVHKKGIGVGGVYTREIAETKVNQVHELAKKNQHPLKCSMERE